MQFSTDVSPHLEPRASVTKVMAQFLLALLPALLVMVWQFGTGVLIHLFLAITTAILSEALVLACRKRAIFSTLKDLTAIITAVLLALSLPVIAPWWVTVIGTFFAIVIAKQLYGGLGYNPFNPAMAGYVLLLVSFPKEMTSWSSPSGLNSVQLGFQDFLTLIFMEQLPGVSNIDSYTAATPLDTVKTQLGLHKSIAEITKSSLFNSMAGRGGEWAAMSFLVAGLWLIWRKVVAWQIPVGMLGALVVISSLCYLLRPEYYASPWFHLFSGATMMGAFFIATDPVTASTTPRGRLIYGALIGLLVYVIRVWGGYPDAVAFSVLLMNIAAPTIDYYTKPRVFGQL